MAELLRAPLALKEHRQRHAQILTEQKKRLPNKPKRVTRI